MSSPFPFSKWTYFTFPCTQISWKAISLNTVLSPRGPGSSIPTVVMITLICSIYLLHRYIVLFDEHKPQCNLCWHFRMTLKIAELTLPWRNPTLGEEPAGSIEQNLGSAHSVTLELLSTSLFARVETCLQMLVEGARSSPTIPASIWNVSHYLLIIY